MNNTGGGSASEPEKAPLSDADAWIPTVCYSCSMGPDLIRVHTIGGVAVGMEGNMEGEKFRQLSRTQGTTCPKAHQLLWKLYDPHRIKGPLKRTNPVKGRDVDPGWVEISWDEALNIVAEKLREVGKKDPRLVGYDERGPQHGHLRRTTPRILLSVYGAYGDPRNATGPSLKGAGGLHCHLADHQFGNLIHGAFICDTDLAYCNYLITVGDNSRHCDGLGANLLASAARERGMREVVVDPYLSATAAKADEWLPIRPGTDVAFLLALIHVIINERGVYDVGFLKEMTNSPYLVGPDGYFVRGEATGKVQVWDAVEAKAKAHDDPTVRDFALEGTYTVDGVESCRPAFQVLKDHVRRYTPEWAAGITDISADTIRRIAREYVDNAHIGSTIEVEGVTLPYRPVCIKVGRGITGQMHGHQGLLAGHILAILVGGLEVPGGHWGGNSVSGRVFFGLTAGDDGMPKVPALPFVWPPEFCDAAETLTPFGRTWVGMMHLGLLNMVDPPRNLPVRPTEVFIRYRTNPVTTLGEPSIVEEAFKRMFVVSFALVHDEMSPYADVILPENTDLEAWGFWDAFGNCLGGARRSGIVLQQPTVQPAHNTMDFPQFFIELADRLGLLPAFNEGVNTSLGFQRPGLAEPYRLEPNRKYSWPDIIDRRIKSLTAGTCDLEKLKNDGAMIREASPGERYTHLFMESRRLRYSLPYMEFVKRAGAELAGKLAGVGIDWWPTDEYTALPTYLPSVLEKVPAEYDVYVIKGRHMAVSFGNAESPWTLELTEAMPEMVDIVMNQDAARARGIQDGDEVWVENDVGKIKRRVKLVQGIRPDTLLVAGEWGQWKMPLAKDTGRVTQTELVPIRRDWTDTLSGNMQAMAVKAKVYKA